MMSAGVDTFDSPWQGRQSGHSRIDGPCARIRYMSAVSVTGGSASDRFRVRRLVRVNATVDGLQARVIEAPPSTSDAVPVTNDESSEAR